MQISFSLEVLAQRLPALYSTDMPNYEDKVYVWMVKVPGSNWMWFPNEYDPEYDNFFGLVKGWETELGEFNLGELKGTNAVVFEIEPITHREIESGKLPVIKV